MENRHVASANRRSRSERRRGGIAEALQWTRDLSGRCARTIAIGSHRLLVENHTGILELTEARIRLGTRCGPITVTGQGLTLCDARRDALIVRGDIRQVELPPEGGAGRE